MTMILQPHVDAGSTNRADLGQDVQLGTRSDVETPQFIAFLRRIVRAAGRRVGDADEIELSMLIAVEDELRAAIANAVGIQRARGVSWAGIAKATGKTPQAAWKRWGRRERGEDR